MLKEKKCNVMQIYCLDDNGYWIKRSIFINMDETFMQGMHNVLRDKKIKNTSTAMKEVIYV